MNRKDRASERGAALITVLMIVAAMSVVALTLTQTMSRTVDRARTLDGQAQLRFHVMSAQEAVKSQLGGLLKSVDGRLTDTTPGLGEPQIFPIEGGQIVITATEASNCFNLNSLVSGRVQQELNVQLDAATDLQRLMEEVGIDPSDARELVFSLVDWMDTDSVPGPSGAEDSYYSSETPPYRTAGLPLAEYSELRAVRGYSPEIMAVLRPVTCVRPMPVTLELPKLNVNTITSEQAGLLVLAMSNAIEIDEARRVIASRPIGGWSDLDAFLAEPAIASIAPEARRTAMLSLVSTYMDVYTDLSYRRQGMSVRFVLAASPGQPITVIRKERIS